MNLDLRNLTYTRGFKIFGNRTGQYTSNNQPNEGDEVGYSMSSVGDINCDGIDDIIIGAPNAAPFDRYLAGESYIIYGRRGITYNDIDIKQLDNTQGFKVMGAVGRIPSGSTRGDSSGYYVSRAGDINGDYINDIIIGAPYAIPLSSGNAGITYIIYGRNGSDFLNLDLSTLDITYGFRILGGTYAGYTVEGVGDINADGISDVAVGVPYAKPQGRQYAGITYLVYGVAGYSNDVYLANLGAARGFQVLGAQSNDASSGYSINGLKDVNGDLINDFIISASSASVTLALENRQKAGICYVIYGKAGGYNTIDLSQFDNIQGFKIFGAGGSNYTKVVGTADINNDGLDDIFCGIKGFIYCVYGKQGGLGDIDLKTLDNTQGFKITYDTRYRYFTSMDDIGDINADGISDVAISILYSYGAGSSAVMQTTVYIIYGKNGYFDDIDLNKLNNLQGVKIFGTYDDGEGRVSGAGDINADGVYDIVIGMPNASPLGRNDVGQCYVIYGTSAFNITPTLTSTYTTSNTPTYTSTPSPSATPTVTKTSVHTSSDSHTRTHTTSSSVTYTRTHTDSITTIPTKTITATPSSTTTPTDTTTAIPTRTPTLTKTPTFTETNTNSGTRTPTATLIPTHTFTPTPEPIPYEKPWHEKLILAAKVVGPMMSAISGAAGLYLKRGLIKSVVFKNKYTKGEEVVRYDYASDYEHVPKNKDSAEIHTNEVHIVRALRKVKDHVPLEFILPRYFADTIKHKPLISGTALPKWLEHNVDINRLTIIKDALRNNDIGQLLIIQIIAHDGEVLEEFPLRIVGEDVVIIDKAEDIELQNIATTSSEHVDSNPSEVLEIKDGLKVSSAPYVRVNFAAIQYANPLLNDPHIYNLLTLAQATHSGGGVSQLIDLGENAQNYLKFQSMREQYGDAKAVQLALDDPHKDGIQANRLTLGFDTFSNVFFIAKELIENKAIISYIVPDLYNVFNISTTEWIGLHFATAASFAYFSPIAPLAKVGFTIVSTGVFALRELDTSSTINEEQIESFMDFAENCWRPSILPALSSLVSGLNLKYISSSVSPAMIGVSALVSSSVGAVSCYTNNHAYHQPKVHQSFIEKALPYVLDSIALTLGAMSVAKANYDGSTPVKHGLVALSVAVLTDQLTKALLSLVPDEISIELSGLENSIVGADSCFNKYEDIVL